ncbi:MAG: DUF1549 domain-containing protein [Pirellulales bacterium]
MLPRTVVAAVLWICLPGWTAQATAAELDSGARATAPKAPTIDTLPAFAARLNASLATELGPPRAAKSRKQDALREDQAFLRGAYLDLVGDLPTPTEIRRFVEDSRAEKRAALVQRLLADPRFGENQAHYWRDLMLARRSDERALIAGGALVDHLTREFNAGAPWDQIASGFITAAGDVREDGRTALIMAQMGQTAETAAEVSRIFLGVQIQCAQCHDHPTDRWKREQFHELAAFFPRIAVRPDNSGERRTFRVVASDLTFRKRRPDNARRGTAEHYMPDLNDPAALGTLMQPALFATGQRLEPGQDDAERRGQLAAWLTSPDNPWFARAMVNRVWSELVGWGFYTAVDDLGPDRTCVAPKTLELLANEFAARKYDVKWLFAAIMATSAYQQPKSYAHVPAEHPEAAPAPARLRPDPLFQAVQTALELRLPRGRLQAARPAMRAGPAGQFNDTFGYDPCTRGDELAGSIPQALLLMNGPLVERALLASNPGGMLNRTLRAMPDDRAAATELYLRCLSRDPTDEELRTCLQYLRRAPSRSEGFEDILWSLVNSSEFIHRR